MMVHRLTLPVMSVFLLDDKDRERARGRAGEVVPVSKDRP